MTRRVPDELHGTASERVNGPKVAKASSQHRATLCDIARLSGRKRALSDIEVGTREAPRACVAQSFERHIGCERHELHAERRTA